jgi:hypothetical protein
MAYKSSLQSFESDWSKIANWAATQKIPKTAYYPVYQLDSQRLLSGEYPMSQAERTRAVLAAYNPGDVTPLPTDNPSPTNFLENSFHDLTNIFTGLEPTRLVSNIFDTIKTTLEHPGEMFNPKTAQNTLVGWIPGEQVLNEYEQGGWSTVAQHPIIDLLNTLPIADGLTSAISHAAVGDAIASSAGMTAPEMAEAGTLRTAGKLISNYTPQGRFAKSGLFRDAEGNLVEGNMTIGRRLKNYANIKGVGSDLADINKRVISTNQVLTAQHIAIAQDFYETAGKLSSEQTIQLWNLLHKSGKDYPALLNDDSIDVPVKEAIKAYEPIENWMTEVHFAAEDIARVDMPDGTQEVYANTPAEPVRTARDALDRAIGELDDRSKKSDALRDEIQANDNVAAPAFQQLQSLSQRVYQSVRGTLEQGTTLRVGQKLRAMEEPKNLLELSSARAREMDQASLGQLLGLPPGTAVTLTQARLVNEMFGPGGLMEQMQRAYAAKDFKTFRDLALKITRRFKSKALNPDQMVPISGIPTDAPVQVSPILAQVRTLSNNLYEYGKARARKEDEFTKLYKGSSAVTRARSVLYQSDKVMGLTKKFLKAVQDHPGDRWRPVLADLEAKHIIESEQGAEVLNKALDQMGAEGTPRETLESLRSDPNTIIELVRVFNKASAESPYAGMIPESVMRQAEDAARREIVSLRAEGFVPHYVPNVSTHDLLADDPGKGTYNVFVRPTGYLSVDSAKSRIMDMSNTIYDISAGVNKDIRQTLSRDGTADVIDNYIIPQFGYKQSELMQIIEREHPELKAAMGGSKLASVEYMLGRQFDLVRFDPQAMFGIQSARIGVNDPLYIPRAIANGLSESVDRSQFPLEGALNKATGIFRLAILGYSPRYMAHILFGGSFLMGLRVSPLVGKYIGQAFRMMKDPEEMAKIHATSTQRGIEDVQFKAVTAFHEAGGRQMGNSVIQEMFNRLNLDPTQKTSWLKVIPQLTFKFTNYVTDMQRALTYLDGAGKAGRKGWFLDDEGKRVEMTADRAHEEGMRAVERVMGDLQHMTPLERNTFTKIMPFYGWTKHILKYVASYPMDHPYRAMFLSNLANQNSEDVPAGLPTRLQLLFFLGQPDADGNVEALDVRALNPLRDVANYATLQGWLSALSPALTALPAVIDPQIIFGSNVLYPTLTYNQLYGTTVSTPQGNLLTAAEQFVPELSALDAALGLSAQYRGLARSSPGAFAKTIFQSLNIPFSPEQINVRQLAAKNELDRYHQAETAAQNYFETGDASLLSGYGPVPDPLQEGYNISPAQLEALYQSTLNQTGLPPSEVLPDLPAPVL